MSPIRSSPVRPSPAQLDRRITLLTPKRSLSYYRARRLGLPPPSFNPFNRARRDPTAYHAPAPAPAGIQGWITDKWDALRNKRTAGGAYESTSFGGNRGRDRRGFGALDPDEAWDARVGNEADQSGYYEEQELGLQDPNSGPYRGRGYGEVGVGVGGIPEDRGRSRSIQRELDNRYDEEVHGAGQPRNPFGDDNEAGSMRTASPRPIVDSMPGQGKHRAVSAHRKGQSSLGKSGNSGDSPTERRSMFHEDV